MIVFCCRARQEIHALRRAMLTVTQAATRSIVLGLVADCGVIAGYCAAIQARTQAMSSSLSAGRASGMGEPQGGVGESF